MLLVYKGDRLLYAMKNEQKDKVQSLIDRGMATSFKKVKGTATDKPGFFIRFFKRGK